MAIKQSTIAAIIRATGGGAVWQPVHPALVNIAIRFAAVVELAELVRIEAPAAVIGAGRGGRVGGARC